MSEAVPCARYVRGVLRIKIDGHATPVESIAQGWNAYTLSLSTTLPSLGVELHSTFVGHHHCPTSRAIHLELAPGISRTSAVEHDAKNLPVLFARDRCLHEHAQQLVGFLTELGHACSVELDEHATTSVERA